MRLGVVVVATISGLCLAGSGCAEDPILRKAEKAEKAVPVAAPTQPKPPEPGPAEAQPGGTGDPSAPAPGVPEEPKPGVPTEPPPGGGAAAGPTVEIHGTATYENWKAGELRITAFDKPQAPKGGDRPKVIAFTRADRPGPFTLKVPEGVGDVWIEVSIDEDGDGRPGPQDPQGMTGSVHVGTSTVDGVEVELTRREPPPGGPKGDL